MKKMLRIAAAFAALLAMTNFIGCSSDDDGGDDDKNGLENTYWTMEDFSDDTEEAGVKLTYKNVIYFHIEDTSKGTAYIADSNSIDYEKLDYTKTNSVDIAYSSEKETFTYVVDGSKITVTSKYTDDAGQEKTKIIEGTLSSDKKSFTTTETEDGETYTTTYTKIDKAPSNATLVITVTGSSGGETGGETGTPKTATIAYDGSSAENAPDATGDDGVFSSVQAEIEGAGVAKGYSLDDGYPKYGSQTYSGDDGVKNGTTSAGMLIVSSLKDGNTKITFDASTVMAYATYKFTLSEKSDVETAVKAFNTQSSALAGKIEIIDAEGNSKASKQAESGSKSANDVTADSVELDAGVYTLKFSWVLTKAAELKKVNCGISSFSIKATTK